MSRAKNTSPSEIDLASFDEVYVKVFRMARVIVHAAIPGLTNTMYVNLTRDLVHDAYVYVASQKKKPKSLFALWLWTVRTMCKQNFQRSWYRIIDVNNYGPMPMTGYFPNQIFGCELNNAFTVEEDEDVLEAA